MGLLTKTQQQYYDVKKSFTIADDVKKCYMA